jgi:hypothetical protein
MDNVVFARYVGSFLGTLFLYLLISRAILMKVKKPKSFIIAAVIQAILNIVANVYNLFGIAIQLLYIVVICGIDLTLHDVVKKEEY